jgi:hypothetical protein
MGSVFPNWRVFLSRDMGGGSWLVLRWKRLGDEGARREDEMDISDLEKYAEDESVET